MDPTRALLVEWNQEVQVLAVEAAEQVFTRRVCVEPLDQGAEDPDAQRQYDDVESG